MSIRRYRPKILLTEYDVGYGKPPKDTQFPPGVSGNPGGRPAGSRNVSTVAKSTLALPVTISRGGRTREVSTLEALYLKLRELGLAGNIRALERLLALAQQFNNDDSTASVAPSADDKAVWEVISARIRSGAAGPFVGDEPEEDEVPPSSDVDKGDLQ